jgi:Flp pilus assembly pilin Flp
MLKRFLLDTRGLETVEYAIIAGLIVGACVVAVIALGSFVQATYDELKNELGA